MTFLTSPNFSHSVRRSSRYSFSTKGSSYKGQHGDHGNEYTQWTVCVCVCVSMCVSPHLKVTGMEHVSNDDNFFMPLPHFSFLLWPPVQLSTGTKSQTNRHNQCETMYTQYVCIYKKYIRNAQLFVFS